MTDSDLPIDPFEPVPVDDELTIQDWLNISTSLGIVIESFSSINPDKPLPSNIELTALRARAAFNRCAAENPKALIEAMVNTFKEATELEEEMKKGQTP